MNKIVYLILLFLLIYINVNCENHNWSVNPSLYDEHLAIICQVYLDDDLIFDDDENIIGAFIDGECRGVGEEASWVNWLNYYICLMSVYGHASDFGKEIAFKYWDDRIPNDLVCYMDENIIFVDTVVPIGQMDCPFTFQTSRYTIDYFTSSNPNIHSYYPLTNLYLGNEPSIYMWYPFNGYIYASGWSSEHPLSVNSTSLNAVIIDSQNNNPSITVSYPLVNTCIGSSIGMINNYINSQTGIQIYPVDYNVSHSYQDMIEIAFCDNITDWLSSSASHGGCGGPGTIINGNEIINGVVQFNAMPTFLSTRTWDVSTSYPTNATGIVNLFPSVMHEILHSLGVRHISNNADAIMNETHTTNYWESDLTNYDKLAFSKLYNPHCNSTDSDELPNNVSSYSKCFPNPFNPKITIQYNLLTNISNPMIEIYNIKGQLIKNYGLEETTGENSIVWNGKDSNGNDVGSGVYFYTLKNNGQILETRKMTLLK